MAKRHHLSKSRIYGILCSMKKRCYNKNCTAYKDYGNRGIRICDEWKNDFLTFYNWAIGHGYSDGLTIERIDVNGNYEPNNCKWIPKGEQNRNTTRNVYIEYNNKKQLISDWSRDLGIPSNTLCRRLKQYDNIEMVFYKGNLNRIINERKRNAKLLR